MNSNWEKLLAIFFIVFWTGGLFSQEIERKLFSDEVQVVVADHGRASPYCGIYALIGALNAESIDYDLKQLVSSKYISGYSGSSADELIDAATSCGAICRKYRNLSIDSLRAAQSPLILHLNRSLDQTVSRHWVLYLGEEMGKARIVDSPGAIELVDYAILLAEWDNMGISVSRSGSSLRFAELYAIQAAFGVSIFVIVGLIYLALLPRDNSQVFQPTMRLVVATVILGMGFHGLWQFGFSRCPNAVALINTRHFREHIPNATFEEINDYLDSKQRIQLVDARVLSSFHSGSLPGAINIPVNATHSQFHSVANGLDAEVATIVFCQSEQCPWGEVIAKRLVTNGFKRVMIYEGGIRDYASRMQGVQNDP